MPPQGTPDFIVQTPLANGDGWVDVNKDTLEHQTFSNVFRIGDNSSLPTYKTGAAIRKQAPMLIDNLLALLKGQPLQANYDGYTSCSLVTEVLFLLNLIMIKILRRPSHLIRVRDAITCICFLPNMYWHGMLRGRA